MNALAQPNQYGTPTQFSKASAPFSTTLSYQGLTFDIQSANKDIDNSITLTTKGLQRENLPIKENIDGKVTGAEIADLNGEGFPEVYIYINANDANAKGILLAYASNKNISITPIHLPAITDDPKMALGYMGHDEFAVVENALERRFRIDGKVSKDKYSYRQIQYKLKAGEAKWLLVRTRATDF